MNIIITAGGTKEAIDKVRYITNMSSGALGRKILEVLTATYHPFLQTVYFLAPKIAWPQSYNPRIVKFIETNSVDDLYNNLKELLTTQKIDAVIHSMAVSDYTVSGVFTFESLAEYLSNELSGMDRVDYSDMLNLLKNISAYAIDNSSKISSKSENMGIALKPTQKVIGNIKKWSPDTILVGFKLLEGVTDDELVSVARAQMEKNDCDYVWANDIKRIRKSGHQGLLVEKDNVTPAIGEVNIARLISETVVNHIRSK